MNYYDCDGLSIDDVPADKYPHPCPDARYLFSVGAKSVVLSASQLDDLAIKLTEIRGRREFPTYTWSCPICGKTGTAVELAEHFKIHALGYR